MSSRKKGHKLMHKLSRFLPGSLIRRHRVAREAEFALRRAEVQKEIPVKEIFKAGRREAITEIAREFLSMGATPEELRLFSELSPFGAVADAMAELAAAG